mmetsp:Transcript_8748/g.17334  ORF Transcript_8748/g.17334 Transcript_8748/m.17334 type:complete len:490 (-) Transcript_8748:43-1512(-)
MRNLLLEPDAAWRERHRSAAQDFVGLLMRIRDEGAERFNEGMCVLWQAAEAIDSTSTPDAEKPKTLLEVVPLAHLIYKISNEDYEDSTIWYQYKSVRRLLSFKELTADLRSDIARMMVEGGRQAAALRALVPAVAECLSSPGMGPLEAWPLGLPHEMVNLAPEFFDVQAAWAVLPLVWLPLALYVRSTMHLYEMLERLHLRAPQCRTGQREHGRRGVEELRELLDRDERHYSFLVFAVVAALQTLHLVRCRMGRHFPFGFLASHPPGAASCEGESPPSNRYPMDAPGTWPSSQLIFRGLWVGAEVDEERARFQYSFQSFSREVSGMNKVLCFYAGARGSRPANLAVTSNHALVLVGCVRWGEAGCLAMPVQLFDGPRKRRSELEVLLPPYVHYEFEDDLSISSEDFCFSGPLPSARTRLAELRRRWGLDVPAELLQMLRQAPYPEEFEELELLRPSITVRFIRRICLPEPMSRLYSDPQLQLYSFGCSE